MERFLDWIRSLPKAVQITFFAALLAVMVFLFVRLTFGDRLAAARAEKEEDVPAVIEFPDAEEKNDMESKLDELQRDELTRSTGRSSASEYWDSLAEEETGGLLSSGGSAADDGGASHGGSLDPDEYTPEEIDNIRKGYITKGEVDRSHAAARERERRDAQSRADEDARADSLYNARLQKALAAAGISAGTAPAVTPAAPAEETPAEEEPRRIDVQASRSAIPTATLASDGIVTSLDDGTAAAGGAGEAVTTPAKATFLRTETVTGGQRVIMRLMQDLALSDGTLIPANTHITGTCKVGKRLNIEVTAINYGGRIYYTKLDVYDNDGTEGIYCPVTVSGRSRRRMTRAIGQTAAQAAGTVLSGNVYAGNLARQGVNEIAQSIDDEGNVSVNVSAGYEFYIFENTDNNQ